MFLGGSSQWFFQHNTFILVGLFSFSWQAATQFFSRLNPCNPDNELLADQSELQNYIFLSFSFSSLNSGQLEVSFQKESAGFF